MRWMLGMPALGALALIALIEVRASAGPSATDATEASTGPSPADAESRRAATALVRSASGSDVVGLVRFWETSDGQIAWDVELFGLSPGRHGFHVHTEGDCSAPDASSAGPHYDPHGAPHGPPAGADDAGQRSRHVGDLGNVVADSAGRAATRGVDELLALRGPNDIVGRSVVVHADPDDLRTQPSGNSGARVGCGVIRPLPPRMAKARATPEEG